MTHRARFVAVFVTVFLFLSGTAEAQWVFLARKALGKVRQFSSEVKDSQQPGYDIATVLLDARADKVYSTALNMLQANKKWTITRRDDKSRSLEFSDGQRTAGLQISSLDDHLSHLVIVSTSTTMFSNSCAS